MKIKEIIKANFLWIFYCITIGLGAFMMFLIQPLIGKIITPQYGGVSQVWCLCLLFFQLALLLGYTLTYFLNFLPTRVQGIIYMLLMTVSLFFVHIPLGDQWMPKNVESPVIHLLTLLLTYLAVPVILLSTVSIIHQNWFKTITDKNPYHLYSLSNLGSLSALIFYPLLIEPNLSISFTLKLWTVFYWILVIFICISSIILIKSCKNKIIEQKKTENHFPIKKGDYLFWLLLSFLGTGLLISFTNHLTHDIAPVPLFWVIPLSLYLISFILCFSSKNLYNRSVFFISSHFLLALLLIIHITYTYPHILKKFHLFNFGLAFISLPVQIFINLLCLFCLCMICNGEIYKSRPHPNHLALFYLIIAFGGALGGIFVNIIAPNIYNKYLEFPLLIFIVVLFTIFQLYKYSLPVFRYRGISKAYSVIVLILIGICVQKTFFSANFYELVAKRNFYGIVSARILPSIGELGLFNGSICHGSQIINFKNKQLVFKPTTYYIESSGVGITDRVMRIRKNGKPLKICTIGLGIGTNAYYGQKGDTITYYELNPDVLYIANNLFTFLKNSKADIKIILGDGRLTLEKQPPQNYDIIIIDAFNNDSIPLHLLTKEAVNLYLKHLNHDGLLVFNISNKYVNIEKALSNLSIDLDLQETALDSRAKYNCFYSIISRDNWFMNYVYSDSFKKEYPNVIYNKPKWYKETGIWTDDYTNLISVMKDFKIK